MNRAFNVHSSSGPVSMEGLSSSTSAVRNKRGDWLSRSKSGVLVKILVAFAACSMVCAALIVSVPYVSRSFKKHPTAMAATYHNTVVNGTYDNLSLDEMLKSYGYNNGLEKDGLQTCELNPESRGELGKGTWTLLHIMAATYPVAPTPEVIQDHKIFFQLLPRIYPCPDCRVHMRKMFHELPPQLNSRSEFMAWICEAHNRVNRRLNKPVFDCSKHDERWDCGCNIVPGQATATKPATSIQTAEPAPPKKERESRASRTDKKDRESKKTSRHSRTEKSDKKPFDRDSKVNKVMEIKQS